MEQLKTIKEQLVAQVQSQMGDLSKVNTHELGEVIDMIKDLSKSIYYCTVVEAMKEAEEEKRSNNYYYTERYYPTPEYYYRDMDRGLGRMYYPQNDNTTSSDMPTTYYTEKDYPWHMRDEREGRSPTKRKLYMESKDSHADTAKSIKELESYMQDLTIDMMEMLDKASPEEKAMLQKKVNNLAAKVQSV